jgi:hypothetical protein
MAGSVTIEVSRVRHNICYNRQKKGHQLTQTHAHTHLLEARCQHSTASTTLLVMTITAAKNDCYYLLSMAGVTHLQVIHVTQSSAGCCRCQQQFSHPVWAGQDACCHVLTEQLNAGSPRDTCGLHMT